MIYLFIISCVLIGILILVMFLILKNAVTKISDQTKAYFVDKLQAYDYLINEKEEKLNEINKQIKEKELGIEEDNKDSENKNYEFDYNIIDLFNATKYQDSSLFELNKLIEKEFNFDYVKIIKTFVNNVKDYNKYNFCVELRNKIDSDMLYDISILNDEERKDYLKNKLTEDEYKIYEIFIETMDNNSPEAFVEYLDQLVNLNNPNIIVLVGNENENYDYISDYVNTKVSKDIYKGIKIIYKDKIYDFSLNERNI